jgi:phage terminase small subunit
MQESCIVATAKKKASRKKAPRRVPVGFAVSAKPAKQRAVEERLLTPVRRKDLKTLTEKERKFVYEFVSADGTITMAEAVIRAGYSEKDARNTARALTDPGRSPHVIAAIQDLRAEYAAKYGTTYERHMRDLQRIRDAALDAGAYGAAVTAEYRRGQALGTIYVDRKEIKVGTIDSMSREEVERRLAEIKLMFRDGAAPVLELQASEIQELPETIVDAEFMEAHEMADIAEEATEEAQEPFFEEEEYGDGEEA